MAANSSIRRAVKRVASRTVGPSGYAWLQAIAMARDIRAGSWEEPEIAAIVPLAVCAGETAVDVGANYGSWTYHLDRAVGATGRVYAYEPVPATFAALQRVSRLLRFRHVELRQLGCSDEPGTLTFTVPVQDNGAISAGQAHLSGRVDDRPGREQHVRWNAEREIACPVVRLDDEAITGSVSFLKADIEGGELLAFRGARDLLVEHRPTIVAEINPWFLDGFGQRVDDLTDFLGSLGYELHRLADAPRRLERVSPADVVEDNYVFVHPTRRERLAPLFVSSPEADR